MITQAAAVLSVSQHDYIYVYI